MPIIYGLAAMAAYATTYDQAGIDPQIDKQYAIVKQGEQPPVAQAMGQDIGGLGFTARHNTPSDLKFETTTSFSGNNNQDSYRTIATTGQGVNKEVVVDVQGTAKAIGGTTFSSAPAIAWAGFDSDSLRRLKGMDRKVSVQFTNASAADVLKWLGKQNVNFVANTDSLPKSKITVNLKNVPLSEALETVAESLGGAWQVKGTTLIFRSGIRSFMASPAIVPGGQAFRSTYNGNFKTFNWDPKTKEYKLDAKAYDLKSLQDFKWKTLNFDSKALNGKVYDLKSLGEFKGKMLPLDGKAFQGKVYDLKSFQEFKNKGLNFDSKALGDMKGLKFNSSTLGFGTTGFKKVDGDKLLKSITNAQKDLMKKQGYLKVSDLTSDQKAMIFTDPKADLPKDFKFIIVINDEKVTIQK